MSGHGGWIVALLVVATVVGAAPMAVAGSTAPDTQPALAQEGDVDADEVRMDVAVRADGSADWTFEFWVRLDDNESETAFESLEADVADDPDAYASTFEERIAETVATASDATGREMRADGFAVETERQSFAREYGVLRYTFRWHGFAAVEDETLRVGDAIEGFYLDDGTRLAISWPESHELESVSPAPDDEREHAVIWRGGETDFVSGEPRLVATPAGWGPSPVVAGGLVAAGAVVVLAVWWTRFRGRTPSAGRTDADAGDDDSHPEADREPPGSAAELDAELLSNEEQVLRLLEVNGGRMKQQTVVEELGWTDAKTSKVVGGLREEGAIESFRIGRENVLTLPEVDVETGGTIDGGGESE